MHFVDVVLQDFCEVVGHYEDVDEISYERMYFRKLLGDDSQNVPSDVVCEPGFVDIPWESRASECTRLDELDEPESSANSVLASKVVLTFFMVALVNAFM